MPIAVPVRRTKIPWRLERREVNTNKRMRTISERKE